LDAKGNEKKKRRFVPEKGLNIVGVTLGQRVVAQDAGKGSARRIPTTTGLSP
jgi:hypothetical protein